MCTSSHGLKLFSSFLPPTYPSFRIHCLTCLQCSAISFVTRCSCCHCLNPIPSLQANHLLPFVLLSAAAQRCLFRQEVVLGHSHISLPLLFILRLLPSSVVASSASSNAKSDGTAVGVSATLCCVVHVLVCLTKLLPGI